MLYVSANSWLGANIAQQNNTTNSPGKVYSPSYAMNKGNDFLRFASPNEQSVVSREDLGFYHALIIAATYELPHTFDVSSRESFYYALRRCIDEHNYLSVVLDNMDTDKAYYKRVPTLNLENHILIREQLQNNHSVGDLEQVLAPEVDTPFPRGVPPWKIIVLPVQQGCLIAFSFSHALGDGIFGKAFHRSFLRALTSVKPRASVKSPVVQTLSRPLPAPFDTPERLPISWSYLLSSSIAYLVPALLGRRASASALDVGTWIGAPIFISPTRMKVREVPSSVLAKALTAARVHDAKLTGLFQHLVARALSKHLPTDPFITNFVSATAINMRKSVDISDDQGGLFTSGCAITHPRLEPSSIPETLASDDWAAITSATQSFAEAWSTTQDQLIGLLKYLPSIRKWLGSKDGQQRSCSFQVSNIGAFEAFDGGSNEGEGQAKINQVVFATPGEIVGGPLNFTLISLKGGNLVYVVSWRLGALDIGDVDEEEFVRAICHSVEHDLISL